MYDLSKLKSIGKDIYISDQVDVRKPQLVEIGDHVAIDSFFVCSTQLKIGKYVHISSQVAVIGGQEGLLELRDYTFASVGSKFICGGENFYGDGLVGPFIPKKYHDTTTVSPIIIEKFAGVCANSTILPGSIISEGSVIGANSLVLKNTVTEPWTIYAGAPIRPIGKRRKDLIIKYATEMEQNQN